MITSRCRDHAGQVPPSLFELVNVYQTAPHLKCAHREVILMFDPDVGTRALAEQRPTGLRGWSQNRMNKIRSRLQLLETEGDHESGCTSKIASISTAIPLVSLLTPMPALTLTPTEPRHAPK